MKLEANWIIESHDEFCLICRQSKGGKFLIVELPKKKYGAFCEECLMK